MPPRFVSGAAVPSPSLPASLQPTFPPGQTAPVVFNPAPTSQMNTPSQPRQVRALPQVGGSNVRGIQQLSASWLSSPHCHSARGCEEPCGTPRAGVRLRGEVCPRSRPRLLPGDLLSLGWGGQTPLARGAHQVTALLSFLPCPKPPSPPLSVSSRASGYSPAGTNPLPPPRMPSTLPRHCTETPTLGMKGPGSTWGPQSWGTGWSGESGGHPLDFGGLSLQCLPNFLLA